MEASNSPVMRSMYAWEIVEARLVFANELDYDSVRIHENTPFPDTINRLGTTLKRLPPPDVHNAITLGFHTYFPVSLLVELVSPSDPDYYKFPWLIHELTHAWQYQHLGWSYLVKALNAQFRLGVKAYDFGDEAGLVQAFKEGRKLSDFNLEQQGDISRTYYERLKAGQDVSAWQPFITELQQPALV